MFSRVGGACLLKQAWIAYSIACIVFWGLWGFLLKLSMKSTSWVTVYFLSALTSFSVALTAFLTIGVRGGVELSNWGSLTALAAGFFGGSGYLFLSKALEKGEATVIVPLTAIYPVVTAVLAYLILGEKISFTKALGVALAVLAVILISR